MVAHSDVKDFIKIKFSQKIIKLVQYQILALYIEPILDKFKILSVIAALTFQINCWLPTQYANLQWLARLLQPLASSSGTETRLLHAVAALHRCYCDDGGQSGHPYLIHVLTTISFLSPLKDLILANLCCQSIGYFVVSTFCRTFF